MSQKQIELQSSDGESAKIEEHQSKSISEDDCNKNVITSDNVTNRSLRSLLFHQFSSAEENLPSTTSKELTMSKKQNELQSSNGESFKVEEPIVHQSSQRIEDDSTKNVITKKKLPSLKDRKKIWKKTTVLQSSNGESVKVEEATANKSETTVLQSFDGESVKVEEANANQSKKIENNCTKNVIPLENVTKKDLPSTSSKEQTLSKKMIVLKSFDGDSFEVEETIARQSKTISLMIDEDCTRNEITLENVTSKILRIVIAYCKKHHVDAYSSSSSSQEDLKKWDAKFMELDQTTIFQLILASNYLNIKDLHDLTCQTVADMIKGKTADQIRAHFNIKNDFTPEEEKQIYHENRWVFD